MVVAVLLLAVWGMARAHYLGQTREIERKLEAAEAREAGLIVAELASQRAAEKSATEADELREQIETVRAEVPDAEVREVTRWKTKTVSVPVDRIVEIPVEVPRGTPDCPIVELPPVRMYAQGSEARLESEAGNHFAVGEIEVWRVADPDEMLFSAPWEADLTELVVVAPKEMRPWRLSVRAGLTSSPGWYVGAGWTGSGRLGYWGALMGRFSVDSYYQDGRIDTEDHYTLAGGLSYALGRK